jgi:hypothetical protein
VGCGVPPWFFFAWLGGLVVEPTSYLGCDFRHSDLAFPCGGLGAGGLLLFPKMVV